MFSALIGGAILFQWKLLLVEFFSPVPYLLYGLDVVSVYKLLRAKCQSLFTQVAYCQYCTHV